MTGTENDEDGLRRVLAFVNELTRLGVTYQLASYRDDASVVLIAIPGERWEVEFLADGMIQVERFRSDGQLGHEDELRYLWERCAE